MSESGTVLQAGDKVGDSYEVTHLIGRGGMGEVWAARHLRLANKQVAVKVLHTKGSLLSPEAMARFKREADVATRINHPNIVEVHDYNMLANGSPYLVLELLQGESLASRLRYGALSLEEAVLVVRQVGSALDASHALHVVHRDLKPDNIFLMKTPMGVQVKVLDFGISKIVDSTTLQTADEVLVGTPQYMSPEQAMGANKDVGPQTDVFAFGGITYEMLTGAPPFVADSIAKVVFRIAYEKHPPLGTVKPELPAHVVAAVERALEKDRAKRYENVADFVMDFTGTPLLRVDAIAQPSPGEQSGVARPGVATPDSIAWGSTATHTPMPASRPPQPGALAPASAPVSAVAAVAPAPVAPTRPMALWWAAGIIVAVLAGFAFWQTSRAPPEVAEHKPVVVDPTPVLVAAPEVVAPIVVAPVVEDAGVAAVAPVAPVAPFRGPVPASPRKKLSGEDVEVIADMEAKLKGKEPYERCLQRLKDLKSPEGISRGYAVAAKAACLERSMQSAHAQYDKISERADRQDAAAFCRTFDIALQ